MFNHTHRNFALAHIALITSSNCLVVYPFTVFGIHLTYAALTYPAIFLVSDLTVRMYGTALARKVIFCALLPSLLLSYCITSHFDFSVSTADTLFNQQQIMAIRISVASLTAYILGQLIDITVFQHFRQNRHWWLAPAASTAVGNLLDTYTFFVVAFWGTHDPVLAQFWPEIALVDALAKIFFGFCVFLPTYGLCINALSKAQNKHILANARAR